MPKPHGRTPLVYRPIADIWRLVAAIVRTTGRLLAAVAGIAIVIVGVFVSLTLIGAIIGIPLILFGMLLTARSIFG